ncbi:MAG: hypothetical protein DRP08_02105 [Candidatus Aenigmatarchaeota archaeon]|nr:MAG: hypothetical protein DRP08_02105 [Candidatus Aenigmarchaeota archaeon]
MLKIYYAVGLTYFEARLNAQITKDTEHMINAKVIDYMKNGVMIINTGWG